MNKKFCAAFYFASFCLALHSEVAAGKLNAFDPVLYGYGKESTYQMKVNLLSIPEIPVSLGGCETWLELDFGNSGSLLVTTALKDSFPYETLRTKNTYWADGSVRGTIKDIAVSRVEILGVAYDDQRCELADWRIYATIPFNGLVGLSHFKGKRITVDYLHKRLYVSDSGLPAAVSDSPSTVVIPLIAPPERFPTGVFFRAKANGVDTVIYVDSGSSKSFYDEGAIQMKGSGNEIEIGALTLTLKKPKESGVNSFQGYRERVAITLGADFLKDCIVTIDRAEGRNDLIIFRK